MLVDGSEDPRTYSKTHRRGLRRREGVYHMAPCGRGTVGTSVSDGALSRAPTIFLFIDFFEGRQNTTPSGKLCDLGTSSGPVGDLLAYDQ